MADRWNPLVGPIFNNVRLGGLLLLIDGYWQHWLWMMIAGVVLLASKWAWPKPGERV